MEGGSVWWLRWWCRLPMYRGCVLAAVATGWIPPVALCCMLFPFSLSPVFCRLFSCPIQEIKAKKLSLKKKKTLCGVGNVTPIQCPVLRRPGRVHCVSSVAPGNGGSWQRSTRRTRDFQSMFVVHTVWIKALHTEFLCSVYQAFPVFTSSTTA